MNDHESPPDKWTPGYPPAMPGYYWWVDSVNYVARPIQQVGFGFYMEFGVEGLRPITELPADGFHCPATLLIPQPKFTTAKDL